MEKNFTHIDKDQIKILESIINDYNLSFEELINELKRTKLKKKIEDNKSKDTKRKNALSIIGKYKSKESDISVNHDKYLSEDFK